MSQVYEIITNEIIKKLEEGTVPWHKPWKSSGLPQNLISKKGYRGLNVFMLNFTPFESKYWLTFKQCKQLGGKVKKGEKSSIVTFWKWFKKEDDTGEIKEFPMLRYYRVFNIEQCEGIKAPPEEKETQIKVKPIKAAAHLIKNMPKRPKVTCKAQEAFYVPSKDYVNMPKPQQFDSMEEFYGVFFHELAHSTGHHTRLNRKELVANTRFGSQTYSKEELCAEMCSAFLCAESGIENVTIDNSASYINNWLSKLKSDKKLLIKAAGAAQKAADFILNRKYEA